MTTPIQINGSEITTFKTFDQWLQRSTVLRHDNKQRVIVCVASDGTVCHGAHDFEYARDNDLFPVVAYSLTRTGDVG